MIITETGKDSVHIQGTSDLDVRIEKLFGPLSIWDLRVTIDLSTAEWVVFQQVDRSDGTPTEWIERARIAGWPDEVPLPDTD